MQACEQLIYSLAEYQCSDKKIIAEEQDPRILVAERVDPTRFVFGFLSILLGFLSAAGVITFAVGAIAGDLAHAQYRVPLLILLVISVSCAFAGRYLYNRTRESWVLYESNGKAFVTQAKRFGHGSLGVEQTDVRVLITRITYELLPRIGKARKSKEYLLNHGYGLWICIEGKKSKRRVVLHSTYETHEEVREESRAMQQALSGMVVGGVEQVEIRHKVNIAYRAY